MKASDIISAEKYYCDNMEAGAYIFVRTELETFILSPAEYERIPNHPHAKLVQGGS